MKLHGPQVDRDHYLPTSRRPLSRSVDLGKSQVREDRELEYDVSENEKC